MLTSVERICSGLSHSGVICDIWKCQIIYFKGRFVVDHLVSVAFVDLSETEHLFILKPVNVKTPSETKHEDLQYRRKSTIWTFTEHRLAFIWNMNTQYQEKYKKKRTFKWKHIFEHPKKIKRNQKTVSSSLNFFLFSLCCFKLCTWLSYTANLPVTLK